MLRKCQAIRKGEVQFEGLFHGFGISEGESVAIIERENGNVEWWGLGVKFIEPERQRVEVTAHQKPTQTGCLVGWYQYGNGDDAGPVALVQLDSRKFEIFGESQIRIIKEVPNGQ